MRIMKKRHVKGESERVKEGSSNIQGIEDNEKETCDRREWELGREVVTSWGMRIIKKETCDRREWESSGEK
jgi:hypothetical protein